jgi:hypothetical protein
VDRLGQSWLGSMGAAALTSVVATVIQTRGRGQWWCLGGGATLAFALAVTGISLPELGLHRSLTGPNRPATFVPPQLTPSTVLVKSIGIDSNAATGIANEDFRASHGTVAVNIVFESSGLPRGA